MVFLGAFSCLCQSIDLVAQGGHLFLLELVHLLLQVHLLTANEKLFLQLTNLVFEYVLLSIFIKHLGLSDLFNSFYLVSIDLDQLLERHDHRGYHLMDHICCHTILAIIL